MDRTSPTTTCWKSILWSARLARSPFPLTKNSYETKSAKWASDRVKHSNRSRNEQLRATRKSSDSSPWEKEKTMWLSHSSWKWSLSTVSRRNSSNKQNSGHKRKRRSSIALNPDPSKIITWESGLLHSGKVNRILSQGGGMRSASGLLARNAWRVT